MRDRWLFKSNSKKFFEPQYFQSVDQHDREDFATRVDLQAFKNGSCKPELRHVSIIISFPGTGVATLGIASKASGNQNLVEIVNLEKIECKYTNDLSVHIRNEYLFCWAVTKDGRFPLYDDHQHPDFRHHLSFDGNALSLSNLEIILLK